MGSAGVVSNKFDLLNRAIENEAEQANQLTKLYRGRKYEVLARTVLVAVIALCLVVLTGGLLYWLLQSPEITSISQTHDLSEEKETIKKIASSDIEDLDTPNISTTYTVFVRSILPSGDTVVTGRKYTPQNTVEPAEQYCYLETLAASLSYTAKTLAEVIGIEIIYHVSGEKEIAMVDEECKFDVSYHSTDGFKERIRE